MCNYESAACARAYFVWYSKIMYVMGENVLVGLQDQGDDFIFGPPKLFPSNLCRTFVYPRDARFYLLPSARGDMATHGLVLLWTSIFTPTYHPCGPEIQLFLITDLHYLCCVEINTSGLHVV